LAKPFPFFLFFSFPVMSFLERGWLEPSRAQAPLDEFAEWVQDHGRTAASFFDNLFGTGGGHASAHAQQQQGMGDFISAQAAAQQHAQQQQVQAQQQQIQQGQVQDQKVNLLNNSLAGLYNQPPPDRFAAMGNLGAGNVGGMGMGNMGMNNMGMNSMGMQGMGGMPGMGMSHMGAAQPSSGFSGGYGCGMGGMQMQSGMQM